MSRLAEDSKAFGAIGEELACQLLRRGGYKILLRNYTCSLGEIDLIAREKDVLVFVEVKSRRSLSAGEPVESVTYHKRAQIIRCANYYLSRFNLHDRPCRFDVVSVKMDSDGQIDAHIIRDAFSVGRF